MGKSLKHQFIHAINSNFKEGMDKHSIKNSTGLGTEKIFSFSDKNNLADFANNFTSYIKEKHPNIKMLKNINDTHIQEFLNEKAKTCSTATLEQYKSKFNKLEKVVNSTYGTKVNYTKGYVIPTSHKNGKIRAVSMSKNDYNKLVNATKDSKSAGKIAIELAGRFGMRVSETTKLQKRDINLQDGKLHIHESKGKRSRDIEITAENKGFAENLYNSLPNSNSRVVQLQPNSVNRFIGRGMEKAGIASKYKDAKTGIHSIRKMAAQNNYDKCRTSGMNSSASLKATSNFLGHGENRETLMKEYVENIH